MDMYLQSDKIWLVDNTRHQWCDQRKQIYQKDAVYIVQTVVGLETDC